jgi:hypothetical protein
VRGGGFWSAAYGYRIGDIGQRLVTRHTIIERYQLA